jgi:alkylation response protein AidB-like acyl-CoA dehydrogenase
MSCAVARTEESTLRQTFVQVCQEVESWPLPGQGSTDRRLELLATCSAKDVVLGRLVEAHADALAILSELGANCEPHPGSGAERRWGVWAAGPPQGVVATHGVDEWRISGTKNWCSGAGLVSHALVDASTGDGQRLFEVDLSKPGVALAQQDWAGPGMRRADTRRVEFLNVAATAIGEPGQYLSRPGFWAGAVGVAACWHGGTVAVAEALCASVETKSDAHALVHLGAVYATLLQNRFILREAGRAIDLEPAADCGVLARAVRHSVERNAAVVLDRVGRALGPRPLAYDKRHAEAVHDLEVYIRQDHAERDLECLGRDLVEGHVTWPI